jgi:hypothetical protein
MSGPGRQHSVNAAAQQLVLVGEMRVEGRAANVRAAQDLFYDDIVVGLLAHQGSKRLAQKRLRLLDASVLYGFVHVFLALT